VDGRRGKPGNGNIVKKYVNGGMLVGNGSEDVVEGWGRFCWGGDLNTVLVSRRKRAGVFDIRVSLEPNFLVKVI